MQRKKKLRSQVVEGGNRQTNRWNRGKLKEKKKEKGRNGIMSLFNWGEIGGDEGNKEGGDMEVEERRV